MAYITESKFKTLSSKLKMKIDVTETKFVKELYDDYEIFFMLNKLEIKELFLYKMLIGGKNEDLLLDYFQVIPPHENTFTLVIEDEIQVKYHLFEDCSLLKSDYLNFEIPKEIRNLLKPAVDEFREWFKQNDFIEKYKNNVIDKNHIIRAFNMKYPLKYNIPQIIENSNLLTIELPNTNSVIISENFNKIKFNEELNNLKSKWRTEFQCKTMRRIFKFKYLINKSDVEIISKISELFSPKFIDNYGLERLKSKFRMAKEIINRLLVLLKEYFRWTFGLEGHENIS